MNLTVYSIQLKLQAEVRRTVEDIEQTVQYLCLICLQPLVRFYQSRNLDFFLLPLAISSESEFYEIEPRLKSAKNRFQSSVGLNLETLNTILTKFKPRLKFFRFGLSLANP